MKVTWLGQGGFFFETRECTVMIDPYLSDSLREKRGASFSRLVPPDERFLSAAPDVLVLTHAHGDHTDTATLDRLLDVPKEIEVLSPSSVYYDLRTKWAERHNLLLFDRGCEWTKNGCVFKAVKAVHSDPSPIGVLFTAGGTCVYVTGDTLYDASIFADLDRPVDLLFVPINGRGNNMNIADAVRFAKRIGPKTAFPVHWGLFAGSTADPEIFIDRAAGNGIEARRIEMFGTYEL